MVETRPSNRYIESNNIHTQSQVWMKDVSNCARKNSLNNSTFKVVNNHSLMLVVNPHVHGVTCTSMLLDVICQKYHLRMRYPSDRNHVLFQTTTDQIGRQNPDLCNTHACRQMYLRMSKRPINSRTAM